MPPLNAEFPEEPSPDRPRNPAGSWLETLGRLNALAEANPVRPGDFNPSRALGDIASFAGETTGIPSVVRGVGHLRDERHSL